MVQLELSPAPPQQSLLARMTFTYALGAKHKLFGKLVDAGVAQATGSEP